MNSEIEENVTEKSPLDVSEEVMLIHKKTKGNYGEPLLPKSRQYMDSYAYFRRECL